MVNLKYILWDFFFIIYKFHYSIGSFFSCLKDNRPADIRLAFQISVGWTVDEKSEKKTPVIITFRKSTKNHQSYSRCWKYCPSSRMYSEQPQKTLFNLGSTCPEISVLSETSGLFSWQSDIPDHIFWLHSRVSKAANIWHFNQTPRLAPPSRISPNQSLCCYITHSQSFPNVCHHQILISIADSWGIQAMPSPVFQYAIDLNMSISIVRDPSAFLNVSTVCLCESRLSKWQKFLF